MGNSSSGGNSGGSDSSLKVVSSNSSPLLFHTTCGENILLEAGGRRAIRTESFCKGICFSSRPVCVNERVCLRVVSLSANWSGFLRVGFSTHDPSTMNRKELPRYSCPDLANLPGYWAKALPDRFCVVNNVICFCVTAEGSVLLMINKENYGILFSGVDTKSKLWAIVDVYGNCTGVELTDEVGAARSSAMPAAAELPMSTPLRHYRSSAPQTTFFHAFCGRNVSIDPSRTLATRHAYQYDNGYVFTSHPLRVNERIVVQILTVDKSYAGGLTAGVTSCDPAALSTEDLPDDSDALLDRSEYWVVHKDVHVNAVCGDELAFTLGAEGELNFSKNGSNGIAIMHVDKTVPLWLFLDMYGQISKLRVHSVLNGQLSTAQAVVDDSDSALLPLPVGSLAHHRRLPPIQQQSSHSEGLRVELPPQPLAQPVGHRHDVQNNLSNSQLRLTLPPVPPRISRKHGEGVESGSLSRHPSASSAASVPSPSPGVPQATIETLSEGSCRASEVATIAAPVVGIAAPVVGIAAPVVGIAAPVVGIAAPVVGIAAPVVGIASAIVGGSVSDGGPPVGAATGSPECIVCFEKACDTVLYTCGHVCMCFECALSIKQQPSPLCPICRQAIQDVIRMYRS